MEFDFQKNLKVDDVEKVPEDFRGLYKQVDDGYALDTEAPAVKSSVAAIVKLNNALKAARAEAAGLRGKAVDLKSLGEFGGTVDEIAENIRVRMTELEGKVKGGVEARAEVEKVKAALTAKHTTELDARERRAKSLEQQLHTYLVDSAATKAITEAKGDAMLLMPFVRDRVRVVENDGRLEVRVVDDRGEQRYSGVTGGTMTINELVAEMKVNKSFGKLFESEARQGSGHRPGSARRDTSEGLAGEGDSPVDKIARGLKKRSI